MGLPCFSECHFFYFSGAQGEYAGLMAIRQYLKDRGEEHRNVIHFGFFISKYIF